MPPEGLAQHLATVQSWQVVLAALTAVPLVVRRRYPLTAFWGVTGATLLFHQRTGAGNTAVYTFVSCVIAAYSAAVYSPYRVRTLTSLVVGAGLIAGFHETNVPFTTSGFVPFLILIGGGLAANTIHTWKQRVRTLERQHQAETRLAVDRERARIARELHDVVAHTMSLIAVQASVGAHVIDARPTEGRAMLATIEKSSRTALHELRSMLGVLREPGTDAVALAPTPTLADLPELVARTRRTGLSIDYEITGATRELPPGVELTGYRVVQEALTNVLRHAHATRARINLTFDPDILVVDVTDDGVAADGTTHDGHGLIGMRERVALHAGEFHAGADRAGGFRVQALIPTGQSS
jgi:signal transduction histidine kinase